MQLFEDVLAPLQALLTAICEHVLPLAPISLEAVLNNMCTAALLTCLVIRFTVYHGHYFRLFYQTHTY